MPRSQGAPYNAGIERPTALMPGTFPEDKCSLGAYQSTAPLAGTTHMAAELDSNCSV